MKNIYFLTIILFCSVSVYSQRSSCIVADYQFDANVMDKTTNNYHGTNHGAIITTGFTGDNNAAFSFNGIDNYIILPETFDYPERSITLWFKSQSHNESGVILNNDTPDLLYGKNIIVIVKDGSQYNLKYNVGKTGNQFEASINLNQWYFVAVALNQDSLHYYLDGVKIYSGVMGYYHGSPDGAENTRIGCGRKIDYFFHGSIDNIKMFNCTLTDSEINQYYTSIKENYIKHEKINLYPNPAKSFVNIEIPEIYNNEMILELYNSSGQSVRKIQINNETTHFQRQDEANGIYYYQIYSTSKGILTSGKLQLQ